VGAVQAPGVDLLETCPTCAAPPRPDPPAARPRVDDPAAAAAIVVPRLAGRDREICLLLTLDTRKRLLGVVTVSVGTVDHTFMSPREVFRDALLGGAASVVVAHNHPSGDPAPSMEDRQVTRRLARAGALLGVPLVDHLVVGDPGWTSLAALGVL